MLRPRHVVAVLLTLAVGASAQDRLRSSPAYQRYQEMARAIPASVVQGRITATWVTADTFDYTLNGQRFRYQIQAGSRTSLGAAEVARPSAAAAHDGAHLVSPDGSRRVFVRDGNVRVADVQGSGTESVTRDGSVAGRLQYGSLPSFYREELKQETSIWWSPASAAFAFYRVDERAVPDLRPLRDLPISGRRTQPYPVPGSPGSTVDVLVHDVASGRTVTLDVHGDRPPNDVGYYVYRPLWTPDGSTLLLLRHNRQQNALDLAACTVTTGRCRSIVREVSSTGSVDIQPEVSFLDDGRRFIWTSERTGYRSLYLYNLAGRQLAQLTRHAFDVADVVRVVEPIRAVFYTAHDGDTPLKLQLHRVSLDGTDDVRLTDPSLHHRVNVAPDGAHFVDVAETHDRAPVSRLMDGKGALVGEIATSDMAAFERLGLKPVEPFTFASADGRTTLHGVLHLPSTFDSSQRYPLLVDAYAGPGLRDDVEAFTLPSRLTELGFLVATLESRGGVGRGRAFRDALHGHVGSAEVDDQAAGVRALISRPYVDPARVGIFGTSYGGYTALMALLRHPDVFAAAVSSSAVTDWMAYRAVYSERYLGLLPAGRRAYEGAAVAPLAPRLNRPLLLYYGTADDNVHPSHTEALLETLRRAGKTPSVQVGRGLGHTAVGEEPMMDFFIGSLAR